MTHLFESHLSGAALLAGLFVCVLLAAGYDGREAAAQAVLSRLGRLLRARRPRRVGPYVLGDKLGAGAMGEVYRARHPRWRRPCAIKMLRRGAPERDQRRFELEAQITSRLRHPNTVSVYDYGRAPDGTAYYVMELLDGVTLEQLVQQHGAQPPARVIPILLQLCAALTEAHGRGLVHRDIKPDNVLLCNEPSARSTVKLLDFGLVTQLAKPADPAESASAVVGTPLYMSPEAIRAPETVSAQSDLYGLGAVAYFLLTGAPVFEGESIVEVCGQHLHAEPRRLLLAAGHMVSRELERAVLDCLAKDPARRPASAAELAARLVRCPDVATRRPLEPHGRAADIEACSGAAVLIEGRFPRRLTAERRACA